MKKPKPKNKRKKKRPRGYGPPAHRKPSGRKVWLNVLPDDLWVRAKRGATIFKALENQPVELDSDCGGLGKCGKCKVQVITPLGPPNAQEEKLLSEEELARGIRLACQVALEKDLVINLDRAVGGEDHFQILKSGQMPIISLDPLVDKHIVNLPEAEQGGDVGDLERVAAGLGPEFKGLSAGLDCLRRLPVDLREIGERGAAVLHGKRLLAWQDWEQVGRRYGLVFDLGTSTLVGKLISLLDGREVAVASCLNGQARHGADVISRLQYAREHRQGLAKLNKLVISDLERLVQRLLRVVDIEPEEVFVAVACGNPTMVHLMLAIPPDAIAEAPFSPALTDGLVVYAGQTGLRLAPEAVLYLLPAKSGYVGGDLIATMLASGVWTKGHPLSLGLDLGTNGEIFLGSRERLLTCSAAAGPALEGSNISFGMIARSGAIESVSAEDQGLVYRTIGNVKPRGLCGSGLVDLVAVLLHLGIIDREGLITEPGPNTPAWLAARVEPDGAVMRFVVADKDEAFEGKPVYLSQRDVRELQLAKAAVAAGVQILMDEMAIEPRDLGKIYLAGALGNYVNPYSAMRVGLLPMVHPEKIISLGNAASTGSAMVLLSRGHWRLARTLAKGIDHVELSSRPEFNDHFVEQMDFPTRNLW